MNYGKEWDFDIGKGELTDIGTRQQYLLGSQL